MTRRATDDIEGWGAIGELYHRYLTGLILALVTRHGTARATETVFRTFRQQHLDLFLPGLEKLSLDELPPAVACAQYHVLSNALGGVRVEWIPETDTKSWVRYLPPRWIFDGTAVCGIPTEVSRAMLRGWHAHNGVSLGNERLGFVATMQTTDGQPGLEGYYIEEDRPLEPEDRLRFRPGERPTGQPVELPTPSWSPERLAKVDRNYSAAYIRSILPAMCSVLGPADAAAVGRTAARQIAMQYHRDLMTGLGSPPGGDVPVVDVPGVDVPVVDDPVVEPTPSPEETVDDRRGDFAARFARLLAAHGSRVGEPTIAADERGRITVGLDRLQFFDPGLPPAGFEAWNGLWEGLAEMEGLRLVATERLDLGDPTTTWRIDEQ